MGRANQTENEHPLPVRHVINKYGKDVPISVPPGTFLRDVFLPKSITNQIVENIPADTVLEIENYSDQKNGLCSLAGTILVRPNFRQISQSRTGLLIAYGDSAKIELGFDPVSKQSFTDTRKFDLVDFGKVADGRLITNRMLFVDRQKVPPLWGYYDGDAKVAIQPQFEGATDFDEDGYARVFTHHTDLDKQSCFLIDTHGIRVPSPAFVSISGFNDGLAYVAVRDSGGHRRCGIINKKFEYVLQPAWAELTYLYGTVYAARRNDGDPLIAITPQGEKLFQFPPDTYLVKENGGLILCYIDKNPGQDRFVKESKNLAVLTTAGKKIFTASGAKEISFGKGFVVVAEKIASQSRSRQICTLISKSGVKPQYIEAELIEPIESDRLIKTVYDLHFSKLHWKEDVNSRNTQFSNFLGEHNLIGMPRSEVVGYLGSPDFAGCYRNLQGTCGSVGSWIEIDYRDERAYAWRWGGQTYGKVENQPWVTTNVVYDYSSPMIGDRFKPQLVAKAKNH